jgi:hypothetical protein
LSPSPYPETYFFCVRTISILQYLRSTPSYTLLQNSLILQYHHPHKVTHTHKLRKQSLLLQQLHAQSAYLITSDPSTTSQWCLRAVFRHKQSKRKVSFLRLYSHLHISRVILVFHILYKAPTHKERDIVYYIDNREQDLKNVSVLAVCSSLPRQTRPPKATLYAYIQIHTVVSPRFSETTLKSLDTPPDVRLSCWRPVTYRCYGDRFSLGHAVMQ